ncbi:MAG: hypothetical protein KGY75_08765 [Candidatus Cloacimonetes bacterium]|nr:hypothetical protein [Candidatus Cloacimonadota bacterium]MBS3768188.1 hypothetical protein [Candidatus Cloacimonadota bacterium]
MDKKAFWEKYYKLMKNIYGNQEKIENLIILQLNEAELDFFKDSKYVLGRFESTLNQFCKICENNIEKLNNNMLVLLLLSYVHLNDLKNAKRIRKVLKEKGMDKERPTWLDGVDDFQPSENIFKGKYITAKYDKRIEDLGKFLIKDFDKIEEFIVKEWGNILPKKMFFNLIDNVGPSPFNGLLYEAYFKVGHFYKSEFIRDYLSSTIVHEIFHFHRSNYLIYNIDDTQIGPFKFIDEGYAEWKRTEYLKKHSEYKIYADNCAYHMLGSNLFELSNLKDKWFKVMFDFLNFPIYETATSFTYFLEDKFGYDKINKIFNAIPDYPEIKTWTDYLKTYFESDLINLMQEWKNKILENRDNKESISEKIITFLKVEKIDDNEIIIYYKSRYPLWAGHNIFIYDDMMKLQSIDKIDKYRFLKDGKLKMNTVKSNQLTIFVHFFQYSQQLKFNLDDNDIYL